jgi:hypothetical protein
VLFHGVAQQVKVNPALGITLQNEMAPIPPAGLHDAPRPPQLHAVIEP